MDLLKTALEWAKAEIFSSAFFILFGALFLAASVGFWQLGKTDFAKAFIYPTLVCGTLLLVIGIGLVVSNNMRVANFPAEYESDAAAFVRSEMARADQTIDSYQRIVFKIVPAIIVLAALLLVFVDKHLWRAIGICTIAMMTVILFVDSNAQARMKDYKQALAAEKAPGMN